MYNVEEVDKADKMDRGDVADEVIPGCGDLY